MEAGRELSKVEGSGTLRAQLKQLQDRWDADEFDETDWELFHEEFKTFARSRGIDLDIEFGED
jgi:23S rRNA A2030 N6-methylase RlmJ